MCECVEWSIVGLVIVRSSASVCRWVCALCLWEVTTTWFGCGLVGTPWWRWCIGWKIIKVLFWYWQRPTDVTVWSACAISHIKPSRRIHNSNFWWWCYFLFVHFFVVSLFIFFCHLSSQSSSFSPRAPRRFLIFIFFFFAGRSFVVCGRLCCVCVCCAMLCYAVLRINMRYVCGLCSTRCVNCAGLSAKSEKIEHMPH